MRFAGQALTAPQEILDTGVAMLPGGEQGPAQGPNIPIKNYGGTYMPDATQPTGYKPGPELAMNLGNPALVVGNQIRKDVMDRGVESGTLQDAYLKGVPGVAKPTTPDVIKRTPAPDLWL